MSDGRSPLSPGDVVRDRFEVVRRLAEGAEGQVLLAHDRELDLDVVVKSKVIVDPGELERLRSEAAMLMRLVPHPGIPLVRSDLVDGDRYLMISDHVSGRDLHDLVAAQAARRLPLSTVLDLVDQVADTLRHLHAHQPPVVHGDVKPENVVVDAGGRAVLVDFGSAMRVGDGRDRLGTPGFSAPEVLAGEPLGPASDVYSLAAVTVYLLTGLVPRLGVAWPTAMAEADLARLERVVRRGLTWDPAGRPWSATEFARDLRAAAEAEVPVGTVTSVLVVPPAGDDRPSPDVIGALEAVGGRQIASVRLPPDRSLLVFTRTSDAAAVTIRLRESSAARFAIHAGDLGGRHGATLQQLADETRALADDGTEAGIVCSPPVRMLLGGHAGWVFRHVTPTCIELLPAPGPTPASATAAPARGLEAGHAPQWISSRRTVELVGRDGELEQAQRAIDRSRADAAAALLLVTGEPGLGKTRFLAELADRAAGNGEIVLVGRCRESGGAYGAFLDALGDAWFPFERGHLERDEEGWIDRRRFFGNISSAIASEGRAVTLVLDDVQWIDGSSLALLVQLLDEVGPSLAVLAGCRPGADTRVVEDLTLRPRAARIAMEPLSVDAFAALATRLDVTLAADARHDLYALTRGNPFFAMQLLEHLRRSPEAQLAGSSLPVGARDWIVQQVAALGDEVAETLRVAAVIGRTFDVVVLADVIGAGALDVLGRLELGQSAGFLAEGERPGEFGFVHAIVQATLVDSSSETRRGLLHAAIARRYEERADDPDQLEAAMHHWLAADRLGDPLHAGEIAAVVGTRTTERLAHERAVSIIDRALTVVGAAPATLDRDRVEARLRVAHGRADFVATRNDQAMAQLHRAADLAERAGDGETLTQAALVASLNRRHGLDDAELLHLLERAERLCPPEPAVLRAMLHVRRSRLLPLSVAHHERSEIARLGLADLDRMDPVDRAMVETEVARACWSPDDAEERRTTTTRIIDDAEPHVAAGGPSRWTGVLIEALNLRWGTLLQLGDLQGALADTRRATAVADEAGTTFLLSRSMMAEAMILAAGLGEHERAEQLADEAIALSDRHNLMLDRMALTYCIWRDRGEQERLADLEDQVAELIDSNALLVAAFALAHAEAGRSDDARRLLGDLEALEPYARNWLWIATTISALEAAILVGDDARRRRYEAALAPFSGQWAVAAAEFGCWGPIDRVLGLAAARSGRLEEARTYLIGARDSALANRASFWAARCHAGLAELGAG